MDIIVLLLFVLLLVFWCKQFFKLMRMGPEDFRSREDKVIWAAVLLLLNVFGAFLFWIHFGGVTHEAATLGLGIYKKLKTEFEDYAEEIDLAMQMDNAERYELEKWYYRMSIPALKGRYVGGTDKIDAKAFGVLLAVMYVRNIEV
jgi:hypothetical protein